MEVFSSLNIKNIISSTEADRYEGEQEEVCEEVKSSTMVKTDPSRMNATKRYSKQLVAFHQWYKIHLLAESNVRSKMESTWPNSGYTRLADPSRSYS